MAWKNRFIHGKIDRYIRYRHCFCSLCVFAMKRFESMVGSETFFFKDRYNLLWHIFFHSLPSGRLKVNGKCDRKKSGFIFWSFVIENNTAGRCNDSAITAHLIDYLTEDQKRREKPVSWRALMKKKVLTDLYIFKNKKKTMEKVLDNIYIWK